MEKPNQIVQMDTFGRFYIENSTQKTILSVAKTIVQERYQVNGLKEKEV